MFSRVAGAMCWLIVPRFSPRWNAFVGWACPRCPPVPGPRFQRRRVRFRGPTCSARLTCRHFPVAATGRFSGLRASTGWRTKAACRTVAMHMVFLSCSAEANAPSVAALFSVKTSINEIPIWPVLSRFGLNRRSCPGEWFSRSFAKRCAGYIQRGYRPIFTLYYYLQPESTRRQLVLVNDVRPNSN